MTGLLEAYPVTKRGGDATKAAKSWLQAFEGWPVGAMLLAYDSQLQSPDRWFPSEGQFLLLVKSANRMMLTKISNLEEAQRG